MRLGILGGTFDPIHLGHLRAAERAHEALGLDRVFLVPAGTPPHRAPACANALDRLAMVCLAAASHPWFVAADDEIRRRGPSYTVETISAFAERFPAASLHLIVGSDTLGEMPTWKDAERLFSLCRVAVVGRPGAGSQEDSPVACDWITGPTLAVSATLVRELARSGRSLRYLVSDAVADYIERRGLYR